MFKKFGVSQVQRRFFNDFEALTPEMWSREGLRILDHRLRVLQVVNRDYEEMYQENGDVVNLHKLGSFSAKRKQKGASVTYQSATSTANHVILNQHLHVSFYVEDRDMQSAFGPLVEKYLVRAIIAIAEGIDRVILGETYNFLDNAAGGIGATITDGALLDLNMMFNANLVPTSVEGERRTLIIGPSSERQILDIDRYVEADKLGVANGAIPNGVIGRARGFDIMMATQAWEVSQGGDTNVAGKVNEASGYPKGTTTMTIDGITGALVTGSWFRVAGDNRPHRIDAHTETTGDTTEITFTPALFGAVLNDAVITVYLPMSVEFAAGYDAQYSGDIVIADYTVFPKLGQGLAFGATGAVYTVIGVDEANAKITLSRPLDAAAADESLIFPIPEGNYNLALVRDAITFVNRPLRPVMAGAGARSFTASYNGVALRVTIGYDMDYQKTKVTVDTLCGVRTLDTDMGGVLLS